MNHKALGNTKYLPKGLRILHEDKDMIVIHKPGGLLSVSTGTPAGRDPLQNTAYIALTDYVKKGQDKSKKRIFIVHRLDRDTSGVLVFAKTPEAKNVLQDKWEQTSKYYFAVVHGDMSPRSGTLTSYLTENSIFHVYSTKDPHGAKLSTTKYEVIKATRNHSLLDLELVTGRKHQIRVHLADAGHPVTGDRKYGIYAPKSESRYKGKIDNRYLALHAYKLTCRHPRTDEPMIFTSPPPAFFATLTGYKIDPELL
jgi:23S rRNA pseudouridine1911/1915/1917 synthase